MKAWIKRNQTYEEDVRQSRNAIQRLPGVRVNLDAVQMQPESWFCKPEMERYEVDRQTPDYIHRPGGCHTEKGIHCRALLE